MNSLRLLLILVLCAVTAPAATVSLSSGFGDTLLDTNGVELDSTFSFELGTFGNSFIPTGSNTGLWEANWKPFAIAFAPGANGWNPDFDFFNADAEFQPLSPGNTVGTSDAGLSGDTFTTGEQLFLWVYDSKILAPTIEWALVTSATWLLPNPNDLSPGVGDFALSTANEAIVGGVNNLYGEGTINNIPGGAFSLQTALAPVPEPSGVLLLLITSGGMLLRRRRAC